MQKITLLLVFLITLALSLVVTVYFDSTKVALNTVPKELYQVYLGGEKIGVIESKTKLEAYIDKQQESIKKKYGVTKVYPPKDLTIQKYISYSDDAVLSEKDVYNLIQSKNPFTIKGYTVRIKGTETKTINVLNMDIFNDAVTNTIEAFITKDKYEAFINKTQAPIKTTGTIIEDVYINPLDKTYQEAYISTDEEIFTSENQLTRYLLFGTLADQQKYVVQTGDTIDQIAYDHKLGTDEFLIVNPEFSNSNSLLVPGQEVSVGLISPIFSVIVEEHIVADQEVDYPTTIENDPTAAAGTKVTKQAGVKGVERFTQKLQMTNGVITGVQIDRSLTQVITAPITEIIVRGTKSTSGGTYIIPKSDGKWGWPTNTPYVITSPFGWRWGKNHDGIDISGTGYGSPIYAAKDGVVVTAETHYSYGLYVIVQHEDNMYTLYAHMSKCYVKVGQTVARGKIIGAMGNSGNSTGTHLHFGATIGFPNKGGTYFNPLKLFQ